MATADLLKCSFLVVGSESSSYLIVEPEKDVVKLMSSSKESESSAILSRMARFAVFDVGSYFQISLDPFHDEG